ncbi:MAG: SIS domain-containing protein [Gammaproteobacteria bacterium]|nr:SIS domain-containing protein [Gammaproteobacteria bacterium]
MLDQLNISSRSMELCQLVQKSQCTDDLGDPIALDAGIGRISRILRATNKSGGNVYMIGNGGSAAVASHIANDLCNVAELRSVCLLDHTALTCFANDYGYENVYSERLKRIARPQDVLLAISSSGESENIVRAARVMRSLGGTVISLSGFKPGNPLRSSGEINLWINSTDYGLVEIGHLFMLHHLVDHIRLNWV